MYTINPVSFYSPSQYSYLKTQPNPYMSFAPEADAAYLVIGSRKHPYDDKKPPQLAAVPLHFFDPTGRQDEYTDMRGSGMENYTRIRLFA